VSVSTRGTHYWVSPDGVKAVLLKFDSFRRDIPLVLGTPRAAKRAAERKPNTQEDVMTLKNRHR